ncbi:MAG: hypothetical protein OHK0021_03460 [Bryobacter sp.]
MQAAPIAKPSIGICFDADFGANLEAMVALSLLYGLDNRNECRVVCLSTTLENVTSAGLMAEYLRVYGGRPIPVGMPYEKKPVDTPPLLAAAVDGLELPVKSWKDTAEPPNILRNALTAQHDGNAAIVSLGPRTNLHGLLHLYAAKPWVETKVREVRQVKTDLPEGWPGKGIEVAESDAAGWWIELSPEAFALWEGTPWAGKHPLAKALAFAKTTRVAPAMCLAVLGAVRTEEFASPLSEEKKLAAKKLIEELVLAKPIPRAPRRRPPAV